jgi:hypothetical protein
VDYRSVGKACADEGRPLGHVVGKRHDQIGIAERRSIDRNRIGVGEVKIVGIGLGVFRRLRGIDTGGRMGAGPACRRDKPDEDAVGYRKNVKPVPGPGVLGARESAVRQAPWPDAPVR